MSAPRSKQQVMIKKFGKMAEQYQARIERQQGIIDRLAAANAVQGDALYAVANDAKNVKEARSIAKQTQEKVKGILAVPKEEE